MREKSLTAHESTREEMRNGIDGRYAGVLKREDF
jgi:hypothetical protein